MRLSRLFALKHAGREPSGFVPEEQPAARQQQRARQCTVLWTFLCFAQDGSRFVCKLVWEAMAAPLRGVRQASGPCIITSLR